MVEFRMGDFLLKKDAGLPIQGKRAIYRKGRCVMARKNIIKILSGGVAAVCIVLLCTLSVSAQQFTAEKITHTISGSVGVPGVQMKGFPSGNVESDSSGFYTATVDWGWSGNVTPTKPGYNFEPSNKSYASIDSDKFDENYTASQITYTISGSAGKEGVLLSGLYGEPVTVSGGSYSVQVPYGWEGTVMPILEGYEFDPPSKQFSTVTRDQKQNFTPSVKKYTVSGTITGADEVGGIKMVGLPGEPVTGSDGSFKATVEHGQSFTVKPTKPGYTFEPPDILYDNIASDMTGQGFYATVQKFTISGTTGLSGVMMKGLPGDIMTGADGFYTVDVPYGWSKTVTPEREGYTFTPASKIYTNVTANKESDNYEAKIRTFTISGSVGRPGVQLLGFEEDVVSGANGSYSVPVEYNWSGTIIPQLEGYNFNPPEKSYTGISKDFTNQNYTASIKTFTINGNTGISNVTLRGFSPPAVSDNTGTYKAEVPYGWSGTITPVKDGFEFDPSNMQYTAIMADEYNQSYTATKLMKVISGKIISSKGQPVEGILVTTDGAGTATTDAGGEYEISVEYGWKGTIMPTQEGYTFNPKMRPVSNVTSDQRNINFNATLQMFKISNVIEISPGVPLPGVTVKANNGGTSDVTGPDGKFTIEVPFGWTGEYTLDKPGMRLNPSVVSMTDVRSDYNKGQPVVSQAPPAVTPPVNQVAPPATGGAAPGGMDITPGTSEFVPAGEGALLPPSAPPTTTTTTTSPATAPGTPIPAAGQPTKNNELEQQMMKILNERGYTPGSTAGGYGMGDPMISEDLIDETLVGALQLLSVSSGIPIQWDEAVESSVQTITLSINDKPLSKALEMVLAGTPYVVSERDNYYLVSEGIYDSPMFPLVSQTRRVKLNNVNAGTAKQLLSPSFQNYVMADIGDVNSTIVLVTAPPAWADRIVSDLRQIDQIKSQVLLKAKVVSLERGDLLNLGVEWGWPQVSAGVFSNDLKGKGGTLNDYGGDAPWGIQIGYSADATFTNALTMALNLLEVTNQARIISEPQLVARDGKQARIENITEEYVILYEPSIATSYYSRQELQEIMSGTVLSITPFIGDNNNITMDVAVEVSDSQGRNTENNFPIISRRKYSSSLHLKDGGTVAVGGLKETRTGDTFKEVPGLSKLPFVGSLFTNKAENVTSKEIAVFITANIIHNPNQMPSGLTGSSTTYEAPIGRTPAYQPPMNRQQMPNDMYYNQPPAYQAPSGFEAPSNQFPAYDYEAPMNNNRAPMPSMRPSEQQFQDELRGALMR